MKRIIYLFLLVLFSFTANIIGVPWNSEYQKTLMDKVGQEVATLSTYPSLTYPNSNFQEILKKYPDGKVLIFGYGSLINANSAASSVSSEAVQSMQPVIALGFKRIFNYKAGTDIALKWGKNVPENERAMLNIDPTTTYNSIINGVVMEVDPKDLASLIQRESGYDLVPMLVANWNEVISENPSVNIKIAYTFFVADELRNGTDYTQTKYYPVRGYLHAIQKGAAVFGQEFLDYWNATTYLSDGTTPIPKWDEQTFSGILDTKVP